ncbi:hypothetical protein GQ57_35850 [Burkholderia sp. MSh2]|uniref:Leucyl aminopeptidase (Aminopeptidase T) n=1 Tax=Burkholderia paludis TaxID=1506587 RepID=A0A6J5F2N8_9BURK|nr:MULTISPECIES: hypothetical protein [Burkholderia]KEZ01312.1 hypothetical protein GQ57_35850 [Burkholderia sp. MSh2]CAB3772664.1 2,5-dihydroxypyridine 5,6-dioxygenase [Burkholderia paludis]VWB63884.1 Leucyl aminopeptidase (aminopeptidase T) [Burkholderia paludis]
MAKTLTELFIDQLKLCEVNAEQLVAVISEHNKRVDFVDAAVAATRQLGAGVLVLTASSLSNPSLPPYRPDGREVGALLAAAAECDFVIDLTQAGLIHSDIRTRIVGKGKRMLFVSPEPADVLERLMGTPAMQSEINKGADLLKVGKRMRITSAAGTDLTVDISGEALPITRQWGFVNEPGRWDNWPSGFIACFPNDKTAYGTIVLQPGDVLIPWQRYVENAVHLKIADGYIVEITGEGYDAFVLRDYFSRWNDPEVYALSHMGWGVHPNAAWSALSVYNPGQVFGQELRSTSGNFMFSTGSNRFAGRETPAHLDIPIRDCTITIDDTTVVRDGRLLDY